MLRRRTLLTTGATVLATPQWAKSQIAMAVNLVRQIGVPLLDPVVTSA